ncbi:MAG: YncE family protein, partial [Actinomycetota bacterium]|nr:YncE family protein [Actinomycetota bacterium]
FTPDGRHIWVTPLGSSDGVEVYDAATGRREARVRLGRHGAVEVVFDRGGRTAYVSQMETATVFAIDTRSHRVVRRYRTGGTWTKVLALSPDEKTLYASNWSSDDVSAITLATGRTRRYPTVRTPRGLYAAPDGRTLYVAGYADGEISRWTCAPGASGSCCAPAARCATSSATRGRSGSTPPTWARAGRTWSTCAPTGCARSRRPTGCPTPPT